MNYIIECLFPVGKKAFFIHNQEVKYLPVVRVEATLYKDNIEEVLNVFDIFGVEVKINQNECYDSISDMEWKLGRSFKDAASRIFEGNFE